MIRVGEKVRENNIVIDVVFIFLLICVLDIMYYILIEFK